MISSKVSCGDCVWFYPQTALNVQPLPVLVGTCVCSPEGDRTWADRQIEFDPQDSRRFTVQRLPVSEFDEHYCKFYEPNDNRFEHNGAMLHRKLRTQ